MDLDEAVLDLIIHAFSRRPPPRPALSPLPPSHFLHIQEIGESFGIVFIVLSERAMI